MAAANDINERFRATGAFLSDTTAYPDPSRYVPPEFQDALARITSSACTASDFIAAGQLTLPELAILNGTRAAHARATADYQAQIRNSNS